MSENLSFLSNKEIKSSVAENISHKPFIGKSSALGASSFYDFLNKENSNKKVYICCGTACLVAKTQEKLKKELLKKYSQEEIGEAYCLGLCYKNQAYQENGQNKSASQKGDYVIDSSLSSPILTSQPLSLEQIEQALKNAFSRTPKALLSEILMSRLRGRGGAGFPMGEKLKACQNEKDKEKYVVCNADEGDPGSYSDSFLLEHQSELVLFGLMMAAYIVGAKTGVIYVRAEYPQAYQAILKNIEKWQQKALVGDNILDSGFNFDFKVVKGAGAYVCGEETALLSSIEGQRPEVRARPPYPTHKGLFNKPTVVNNVETLSCLYDILTKGGKAFSKLGTKDSTGTKLVSLNSFFVRSGVYEVEMGTPLDFICQTLGRDFTTEVKALQIGGPLGGVVPMSQVETLKLDFESFAVHNFSLGHASIVAIPSSFPMIKYLEHLFKFTSNESCGKCIPCRVGSRRGYELIKKAGADKIDLTLFQDLLETMEYGSLCGLGQGLPLPVKNILKFFHVELKNYFRGAL